MKSPSKINRKSKAIVDQLYDPKYGWQNIKPIPLRELWWKSRQKRMRFVEVVHFVNYGDYRIGELI